MAKKYSSKINKIRTFALSLIFIGFFVMYFGIFFRNLTNRDDNFYVTGFTFYLGKYDLYFWIGMLSTKTVQVICPNCSKHTKILGQVDICMYCKEPLTLDPNLEGKEFDES